MKIPDRISKKVDEILTKRKKDKAARHRDRDEWNRKLKELEALKKSREDELLEYAGVIIGWIDDFLGNKKSGKVFRTISSNGLSIFGARFWLGFPDYDSRTTYAEIIVARDGKVRYVELHKGQRSHETSLGCAPLSSESLIQGLHPEFLKQWAEAVKSGKVWDFVERSLR